MITVDTRLDSFSITHFRKLFQTPDPAAINKTHQFHAPRPPSISRPAESLQNGYKVTRTYSNGIPSYGFFSSGTAHSITLTRQLKLEETWATSDQSGQETAKMGSFHGEHTGHLLKKPLVLGSLQNYRKGHGSPKDPQGRACATTALTLFRNRLWKQQPLRYPWNSSSSSCGGPTVGEARTE